MCGICGIVNTDPEKPVNPEVLRRMNDAIRHRGPDSDGFFVMGNAGLAVRRLAIIDLLTGDQPMRNEDGTLHIVFNGEIYNHAELRGDLESRGHVFRSRSDTEVILHLYEECEEQCLEALRGMFAVAIWDGKRRRLFLARDRLGKKPLYYCQTSDAFLFGSELKCLLEHPSAQRRADLEAIDHYLTLQYVPDPVTGFAGIRKLPPAHRLVWQDGTIRIERYWEINYEPKWPADEQQCVAELRQRLAEAVKIRLISDVPLGAHLSGGIDSSIVVALMAETGGGQVKTFSIGFEEERFSELPFARKVVQRYGTDHHEFVLTYGDVPTVAERMVGHFDEPFADSSALPLYHLAKLTRDHVTVALNGDGGDELFAGYQRYLFDRYAGLYARLPVCVTQKLVPFLVNWLPEPVNVPIESNFVAGLRRLAQVAAVTPKASIVRWGSYFTDKMKDDLWKPEHARRRPPLRTTELLARCFDTAQARSFLDRTLYTDTTYYLPGDLLVKADRMTMAHSLEARSPFLDHRLVEWAARLPVQFKLRRHTHKYLLKRAFAYLLPPELLRRRKQGFAIPVGTWFRGPLRQWAHETLLTPDTRIAALFRTAVVQNLLTEHIAGRVDHGKRIWALI
ncbi:MAG: asparagine synthase (glutamine-hydrolyzing), partial [Kiritimatiellae bacterium]|nr:asparagine synthase (glutamine-hydrolyzing) [Kiritimatiellia bacterium]